MHFLDEELLLLLVFMKTLQKEFLAYNILFQFIYKMLLYTRTISCTPLLCILQESVLHPP